VTVAKAVTEESPAFKKQWAEDKSPNKRASILSMHTYISPLVRQKLMDRFLGPYLEKDCWKRPLSSLEDIESTARGFYSRSEMNTGKGYVPLALSDSFSKNLRSVCLDCFLPPSRGAVKRSFGKKLSLT
jgi:hypothetical protein